MPKVVAIDYGSKRCGIAATDDLQIIASGLKTVDTKEIFKFLTSYFEANTVDAIVLGEPKRMDTSDTHNSQAVRDFKKKLETLFPDKKIHMVDERFTSKMAFQTMIDAGLSKKRRKDKALVDEISATIILQSYLQSRAH
jgi:putative holliday junction resolvase